MTQPAARGPYQTDLAGTLDALRAWLATDSRDWSITPTDARLWAVLCGWGPDRDEPGSDAWAEVAEIHGWPDEFVAALKARHATVLAALSKGSTDAGLEQL